jgi:CRP-like cAMP-binding protein
MQTTALLRSVPMFKNFSATDLEALEKISLLKKFPGGTNIFFENDLGTVFYIVVLGSVKIYQLRDGKEKILTIMKEGGSFGELALFDEEKRSASAQTLEKTTLCCITKHNFMELLQNNFDLTQHILKELSTRIRRMNQHVSDLVFLDAKSQVIKALINLANEYGQRESSYIRIDMRIGYDEIGKLAGISQRVVNDVLALLESKEIIVMKDKEIYLYMQNLTKSIN